MLSTLRSWIHRGQPLNAPGGPPLLLEEGEIEIVGDLAPAEWDAVGRERPAPPIDWPRYLGLDSTVP